MNLKDLTRHMSQYFKKNREYSSLHHTRRGADSDMMKTLIKLTKMSDYDRRIRI